MSILTFKTKHNRDFSKELYKAGRIAKFAMRTRSRSSKDVKHFNLPSVISNQILKKYSNNKKAKRLSSVKLTIPNQGIKLLDNNIIKIPCLKLELNYNFEKEFFKIKQIEISNKYAHISVEIKDMPQIKVENYLGVDRNTTGHCAVVGIPTTGKVYKLGKSAFHTHRKYKKIRKHLQEKNAKIKLKKISKREKNIIKDINHKISRKIVDIAIKNQVGIKLEKLGGIRKVKCSKKVNKSGESFKSSINTWEFYQLQSMIEYKSKICGIPVVYVNPHYTSQKCSRCGVIGTRNKKKFSCSCGHVDHADANASFNIGLASPIIIDSKINNEKILSNDQSLTDRPSTLFSVDNDVNERNTDIRQLETQLCISKVA
jgi:putative transposase